MFATDNRETKKEMNDAASMLCGNVGFEAAEAYKLLRTNTIFTLADVEGCRFIGITSADRGEGKSTTSVNLAYTFAETGKRVLLIDGDLRLPTVGKKLGIKNSPGLSNILIGQCSVEDAIATIDNNFKWYVIPSGNIPPNPSELLGSSKMGKLKQMLAESFDYVIIDLPPVNVVSDALVVSSFVNGLLMVVRENIITKRELKEAVAKVEFSGSRLLGFVMTDAKTDTKSYGKKGKYGKYGKYGKKYGSKYGYSYSYGYGYGRRSSSSTETKNTSETDK